MSFEVVIQSGGTFTATVNGHVFDVSPQVAGDFSVGDSQIGPQGNPGAAATIAVGTVETGDAGTPAVVENVGTSAAAIFDFTIPQGIQGIQGEPGDSGIVNATAPLAYDAETKTVSIDLSDYATTSDLGDYLPLAGGTMSGSAVFSTDGTSDSEVGGWGFGVQLSSDNTQFTTVAYGGVGATNTAGTTSLTPAGVTFPDLTVQTTAYIPGSGDFLPLAGGTMTGNIVFGDAGQYLGKGTFDTSRGGGYGLSLVCSVGYEFNWQAGWLITTEQNSTTPRPLYLDSLAGTTLRAWEQPTNTGTEISHTGITFADATVQSTAYTGQNIFDQSLNIADSVDFSTLEIKDPTAVDLNQMLVNTQGFTALEFGGSGSPLRMQLNKDGLQLLKNGAGITFSDTTVQTTAFPPAGGTALDYIDGTGALQIFPTGTAATKLETTVYNETGATIPKHHLVYINGRHGNDPTIALAKADAELTSRSTFGFTTADIPNHSLGTVTQVGLLEGVNTNGITDGTLIYLSPTTAGDWTTTQPYSPNHYVNVGTVIRGHPTQGTIQVRITNSNELVELSDVQISSAVTGDYLVKNGSGYWVGQAFPSASTTVEGKVELATTAEAIAGTDTSRAVTPSGSLLSIMSQSYNMRLGPTFGFASAGTGAGGQSADFGQRVFTGTTSGAYGIARVASGGVYPISRGKSTLINLSKPLYISFIADSNQYVSNSIIRFTIGKTNGDLTGNLGRKGFGIRIDGAGAVELQVHNGSTLTNVASSFTPTALSAYDVLLYSDGSGNVTLYINDIQVATTSLGATGDLNSLAGYIYLEAVTSAVLSAQTIAQIANLKVYFGR